MHVMVRSSDNEYWTHRWSDMSRQYAILARQYAGAMLTEEEPERITHILRNDNITRKGDFRDMANILAAGLSMGGTQHYVAVFDVPGSTMYERGLCDVSHSDGSRNLTIAVIWK